MCEGVCRMCVGVCVHVGLCEFVRAFKCVWVCVESVWGEEEGLEML